MLNARLCLSLLAGAATLGANLHAQVQWKQASPTTSPPALSDHVMVAPPGRAWLFGGAKPGSALSNETWIWNGVNWTKQTPPAAPTARMRCAGAYDLLRGKFILFGGSTGLSTGLMNDTWEFDGKAWAQIKTLASPSARNDTAMAYDLSRRKVVLLGGRDSSGALNDHWEYDGKNWVQIKPQTLPTARQDHSLVYDSGRKVMIAFGGFHSGLQIRSDLWEYDGTNWKLTKPPGSPGPRVGHGAAYDSYRRVMVVFSGYDGTGQPADTYEWNGTKWVQRNTKVTPPGRSGHTMVYDLVRYRMVMYGGWSTQFTSETWSYDSTQLARVSSYGVGCPSSVGTARWSLLAGALPWTGHTMKIAIQTIPKTSPVIVLTGASDKKWGPLNLPFNLKGLGMPGCQLFASPDLFGLATNNQGVASMSLPIPNDPNLFGATFYQQGMIFEKGVNGFGAVFSDAGKATIGVK